jgi:hypothetical protein
LPLDTFAMKDIVLVTLGFDLETGGVDPSAPFMVISPHRGASYNRLYQDAPHVIEQFRPGEWCARFEAEWDEETENWILGKRMDDA